MNLYQETLMDHFQHPRNRGVIGNPDFSSAVLNPSCGDQISIMGKISDRRVVELKFTGTGCVISQATASLLSEYAHSKSIAELKLLDASFIQSLIGISLGPTRLRCALLSLEALQQGLTSCLTDQK